MTLNPDVVRARCAEIEESVQRLETLAAIPLDDFLADRDAQGMAKFRNLLVHVYWQVDYRRVHAVMQENLSDLRAFAAAVVALL